jgi:predicted flap endonuclease-1-like 5' DNA nuclease
VIAHLAEVWVLLLAVFLVGCVGGALLFTKIATSRFASAQWVVTDALGRVGDSMRDRFGMAPIWRGRRLAPAIALQPAGAADQEATPAAGLSTADGEPVWEVVDRTVLSQSADPVPDPEPLLDDASLHEPIDMEALLAIAAQFHETPRVDQIASPVSGNEDRREAQDSAGDDEFSKDDEPGEAPPAMIRPIFPPSVDEPPPQRVPRTRSAPLPPSVLGPPVIRPDAEPPAPAVPLLTAREDIGHPTGGLETRRPATLIEPRNGVPDNLRRIRGIGDRNEVRLNKLGIFHFSQIAAWTPAEVRWIGQQLAFPERIERDDWVGQAIVLATGGETGFTKSVERRRARRRNGRDGDDVDLD